MLGVLGVLEDYLIIDKVLLDSIGSVKGLWVL